MIILLLGIAIALVTVRDIVAPSSGRSTTVLVLDALSVVVWALAVLLFALRAKRW